MKYLIFIGTALSLIQAQILYARIVADFEKLPDLLDEECTDKRASSINKIIDNVQDIDDHHFCNDYEIGEERQMEVPDDWAGGYLLKKNSDGSYTASMALEFYPDRSYDGPVPRQRVHSYYLGKMQGCIREHAPYMKGPNGEQLRIEIMNPKQRLRSGVPTHRISIQNSRHRDHSTSYSSDIDCQTVTHEVLHLLGLHDEYREMHTGYATNVRSGEIHHSYRPGFPRYNYDCRVSQSNSIMGFHWHRFHSLHRGEEQSLLDPAHFNAILYGECEDRDDVRLFRECSELSYKNSRYDRDCLRQKAYCDQQDVLGRNQVSSQETDVLAQNQETEDNQTTNNNTQEITGNTYNSFIEFLTNPNLTEDEKKGLTDRINNLSSSETENYLQFLQSIQGPNLNAEGRRNIAERIGMLQKRKADIARINSQGTTSSNTTGPTRSEENKAICYFSCQQYCDNYLDIQSACLRPEACVCQN